MATTARSAQAKRRAIPGSPEWGGHLARTRMRNLPANRGPGRRREGERPGKAVRNVQCVSRLRVAPAGVVARGGARNCKGYTDRPVGWVGLYKRGGRSG